MSKQSQFESLDDMLSELNNISEDGGLVENVILLARVFDNDSEEELSLIHI